MPGDPVRASVFIQSPPRECTRLGGVVRQCARDAEQHHPAGTVRWAGGTEAEDPARACRIVSPTKTGPPRRKPRGLPVRGSCLKGGGELYTVRGHDEA